jgi:hypothetical protein
MEDAGVARRGAAEPPVMSQINQARLIQAFDDRRGIVAATVIDHDDFQTS